MLTHIVGTIAATAVIANTIDSLNASIFIIVLSPSASLSPSEAMHSSGLYTNLASLATFILDTQRPVCQLMIVKS